VALIGIGNIGSALVSYKEFARQGFNIRLLFDNDQRKIGSNHKGITVLGMDDLERQLKESKIELVILAVPASSAQAIVDHVVNCGIKAILNFAPIKLTVPEVFLRTENMSMELEYLSFSLVNNCRANDRKKLDSLLPQDRNLVKGGVQERQSKMLTNRVWIIL
jgi:redox-sensing transcriptional repressor